MLYLCCQALSLSKTQLIKFCRCSSQREEVASFLFVGQTLSTYSNTVTRLGHTLTCQTTQILQLFVKICAGEPTTCLLFLIPVILSLRRNSCPAFASGSALWRASSSELRNLEISLNNILRKIWSLPRRCHTAILHRVAGIVFITLSCPDP